MRLTWRKRSAAPRELLVLVLFLVTLFFVVVIGERNGLQAAEVGHRDLLKWAICRLSR
jgi:hypothetical protein